MTYSLIIFDCDGTLVDTEHLNCLSLSEVLIEAGFTPFTQEVIYKNYVGLQLDRILDLIAEKHGQPMPADMTEQFIARVRQNAPAHLKPIENALRLATWAEDQNYKLCVGSNGERANVLTSVEMAGLKTLFPDEAVFTSCQVTDPKPAPDLFHYAADKMGVDYASCLVIEDSPTGVKAGKAAGMTVIATVAAHEDKDGLTATLREAGADHIVSNLAEIQSFLTESKNIKNCA